MLLTLEAPHFSSTMCRVWNHIWILCALTRISQTDPMETGVAKPSPKEEEQTKKLTSTLTFGDSTKALLSEGAESTVVSSGAEAESTVVSSGAPDSGAASSTEGFSFHSSGGPGYGKLTPEKAVKPNQPAGSMTPGYKRPLPKEGDRPSEETSGKPQTPGSVTAKEEFTFRPLDGGGNTNVKLEKPGQPKTTPHYGRPLHREEIAPSSETTPEEPRQRTGKAPVKEASAKPKKVPFLQLVQPFKKKGDTCTLGIFKPVVEGAKIVEYECKEHCMAQFGEIVPEYEGRVDITEHSVTQKGKDCRCTLNKKGLQEYFTNHFSAGAFQNFFDLAYVEGFCSARVWLRDNGVNVHIPYEAEAKEQRLRAPSAPSTPIWTPSDTPLQSPSMTPLIRTPQGTPPQSPGRTFPPPKVPVRVDAGKGVAKSSIGTVTAPGTPDQSRLGTAPGTPDRYSLNRDITGKGKAVVDTSTDAVTTEMKDVIVGSFKKRAGSYFSTMICKQTCYVAFGQLRVPALNYQHSLPFTRPMIRDNGMICNCIMESFVQKFCAARRLDYNILVRKITENFFCDGKVYIEHSTGMTIDIQYEYDSRPNTYQEKERPKPVFEVFHTGGAPGRVGVGDMLISMATLRKEKKEELTDVTCQNKCDKQFGFIHLTDKDWLPFTLGRMTEDWHVCECIVNSLPIKEQFVEIKQRGGWTEFATSCDKGYFPAVKFLEERKKTFKMWIKYGKALKKSEAREIEKMRGERKKIEEKLRMIEAGDCLLKSSIKSMPFMKFGDEECKAKCNQEFGWVVAFQNQKFPFASPRLSTSKKRCECWFNKKILRPYLEDTLGLDFIDFMKVLAKGGYERGVAYLAAFDPVRADINGELAKKWPKLGVRVVDENGELKFQKYTVSSGATGPSETFGATGTPGTPRTNRTFETTGTFEPTGTFGTTGTTGTSETTGTSKG